MWAGLTRMGIDLQSRNLLGDDYLRAQFRSCTLRLVLADAITHTSRVLN